MSRETVWLGIGQFGVQASQQIWELFCTEHDIDITGFKADPDTPHSDYCHRSLFMENRTGTLPTTKILNKLFFEVDMSQEPY